METNYNYTCPHCSQECSVVESATGQNVVCPYCAQEFFATAPDKDTEIILPEKLPFFKAGRKKILEQRMHELVADGELSTADKDVLTKTAILLDLKESDLKDIRREHFLKEFEPIQRRMESQWQMTDGDLAEIEALKTKYGVNSFTLEGTASLFRQIYLLEAKGELPPPIGVGLMLGQDEPAYFRVASTWQQTRVRNRGYAGGSVSLPTGIKGVRFRFGQFSPIRSEEITPLSDGYLYVTPQRLLFHGGARNTKVDLRKIVDLHIYTDALKVEKATGKPDYFSMNAAEARFISSLIDHFRSA